jgi:hypothetical protein
MNYLAPRVCFDVRYVVCLSSSMNAIATINFVGGDPQHKTESVCWASCRFADLGLYWEFLMIETALESTDRRSCSIHWTHSFKWSLQPQHSTQWFEYFLTRRVAVGSTLKYGMRITLWTLCTKVWSRQVIKGIFVRQVSSQKRVFLDRLSRFYSQIPPC